MSIPSVANVIPISNPLLNTDVAFQPLAAFPSTCLPVFNTPFTETRRFKWNLEQFVHKSMSFSYFVGEGPLYWYRIDWYPSVCPSTSCMEMGPTISYIGPNCPYEIIESCIILPPDCPCFSCIPGTCVSQTVEVWHMLATSVIHLCERINQECCHRKPPGYMRRVRQYMRPALCCDVQKICGTNCPDVYVDVDFLKCECGNLVDPCIARIIYPCHVNRCAIHGPAFSDGDKPPIDAIKMAPDLLGHMPIPLMQEVSAMPVSVQIVAPKEMPPPKTLNKYGSSVPEIIHCGHNLSELNLFKDFIKLSKIKFDNLDLYHNKSLNAWYGSQTFRDWKVSLDWTPAIDTYKINLSIDKGKLKSKVSLVIKDVFSNDKGNFEVNCLFDPNSGVLRKGLLQSKVIKDDIGLFKNFKGNLRLIMKG